MEIQFIEESEMEFTKRGRKSNLSESFVNNMREQIKKNNSVAKKQFLIIQEMAVPSELNDAKEIKNYKAKVAANLRGLAKHLGYGSEIRWHKGTVPAIRFTAKK